MMLNKHIHELDLTTRSLNCLFRRAGIYTIGDLVEHSATELLKIDNFGKRSYWEVEDKLRGLGLKLKDEEGIEYIKPPPIILTKNEAKVLILRGNLRGFDTCTFKQIGKNIGLTPERIRQIEIKAIKKILRIAKYYEWNK